MTAVDDSQLRRRAREFADAWWFSSVFDAFDPLLEPLGYELIEASSGFRGSAISYLGPRYRIVFEFDPETRTLRGEFWDEFALDQENHLWVLRFWDLLRARDQDGHWEEPPRQPMRHAAIRSLVRSWASALGEHASDVLQGADVSAGLWKGIW